MFDLENKIAIVTGGARNIGKSMSSKLLEKNCKVCIADTEEETGFETVKELQITFGISGNRVCFVKCDISREGDWISMWSEAEKKLGGPVELLVNVAGIYARIGQEPLKIMEVNGFGTACGMSMAIKRMSKLNGGNGGRIVNVSSVTSLCVVKGDLEMIFYSASKCAVTGMTRATSSIVPDFEMDHGMKCYALAPYAVDTDMFRFACEKSIRSGVDLGYKDIKEFQAKTKTKVLRPEDLGQALLDSLDMDKNGRVYLVWPDTKLIVFHFAGHGGLMTVNLILGKLAGKLFNKVKIVTTEHLMTTLGLCLVVGIIMFTIFMRCICTLF